MRHLHNREVGEEMFQTKGEGSAPEYSREELALELAELVEKGYLSLRSVDGEPRYRITRRGLIYAEGLLDGLNQAKEKREREALQYIT